MLLKGKIAIIYGVSNSLGGTIAKAFAKQGAILQLTARNLDHVQPITESINASGGKAFTAKVDALNEDEVNKHLEGVVKEFGAVDISFNLIDTESTQNIRLIDMELADFIRPVDRAMRTQFITCTAAGRQMSKQNSGVILSLTATPGGIGYPEVGGFGPACCGMEAFSCNLAIELGPKSVRVVNIRSAGSPDSRPFREAVEQQGDIVLEHFKKMAADTMLKELPMMQDIANAAVFLASDMASKITGVTLDITGGTTMGLNYKTSSPHTIPLT